MIGEIVAIGDELTSGRILNSTSQFAAHHLFAMGHEIVAMSTIGDALDLIGAALRKALNRADFVIVTGGLGPTSDDLTSEAASSALGRPPTFHPEILNNVKAFLGRSPLADPIVSGKKEIELEKLAWLPAGAEVLKPESNMAGYGLVHDGKPIFFLPGVPHEMRELLIDVVIPRLAEWKAGEDRQVRQRLYRIFGLPESEINCRLAHLENDNSLVKIGYYPVYPEVHLNLTVLGDSVEGAEALLAIFETRIQDALGDCIYAQGEESLADTVGHLLRSRGATLATAESCTGGLLSHLLTGVAGSSDYFLGGVTAYSNEMKSVLLRVKRETVEKHGAVSVATARAMAEGVCEVCGADFGISVTGIAGPGGGTNDKPVGTVCFGLATPKGTYDYTYHFGGVRHKVQVISAYTGLDLLRRKLLEEK